MTSRTLCAVWPGLYNRARFGFRKGTSKFYLTMQIHLVLLVGLFAALPLEGPMRDLRRLAVGCAWVGLAIYHVLATLPYETRGGVFTVVDIAPTRETTIYCL